MKPLPHAYAWIDAVEHPPSLLHAMRELYGTLEGPGGSDNPTIMAWAAELGLSKTYSHDATPWCGLAVAKACRDAGWPVVDGPLWALNWSKWGEPQGQPGLGDVLVFVRPGGGHVGLYVGQDSSAYHVLGGNTGDAVAIARIDMHRLHSVRHPPYKIGRPASAVPHILAVGGALSTNEA